VEWADLLQQFAADRRGDEAAADAAFQEIIHGRSIAAIGTIVDRLASLASGPVEAKQTEGQTGDPDGNAGLQGIGGEAEAGAGV
jgi:hypothetical protein